MDPLIVAFIGGTGCYTAVKEDAQGTPYSKLDNSYASSCRMQQVLKHRKQTVYGYMQMCTNMQMCDRGLTRVGDASGDPSGVRQKGCNQENDIVTCPFFFKLGSGNVTIFTICSFSTCQKCFIIQLNV